MEKIEIKKEAINALQLKDPQVFLKGMDVITLPETTENISVKNYIFKKTSCFDQRLLDSLKLVNLNEAILNRKILVLSSSEKIKIELAIHLIQNTAVLYLYEFDRYFMEKDLLFFKKLFKKLVTKYHKTICFINCHLSFLLDFAQYYCLEKKKNQFIEIENPTFYEKELLNYVELPKIVEFINYINEEGKKINQYVDLKELLKAIFREV